MFFHRDLIIIRKKFVLLIFLCVCMVRQNKDRHHHYISTNADLEAKIYHNELY